MQKPDLVVSQPDFSTMPAAQLQSMQQAGQIIQRCYHVLRKAQLNIVGEVLRDTLNRGETFYELTHYPEQDVYDPDSAAQYYYHAHRGEMGEHGHFHCFLRAAGMPGSVTPVTGQQNDEAIAHLIAIAMDEYGFPTGLFTVNRWVTDENWYEAAELIPMLDRFFIDHAYPSWPVNQWISAMIQLFKPHITQLIRRRDEVINSYRAHAPQQDIFELRQLDITSMMTVSVEQTIKKIETHL